MSKAKYGAIGIVLVAIIILLVFPVTVTHQEQYTKQIQKDLNYDVIEKAEVQGKYEGLNAKAYGFVRIKNTDTEPGTFKVNCHFRTANNDFYPSNRAYIEPGETVKIGCTADTEFMEQTSVSYEVIPGTKTVKVEKTRTEPKQVRLYQKLLGNY